MTDRRNAEHRLALELHRMVAATGDLAHHYAATSEMGATDFSALMHIWEAGVEGRTMTPGELATKLKVTRAAVTYLVERLVSRGYVERSPNPDDRRQVLLTVSAPGGHLGHGYLNPDWFSTALGSRTDDELAAFTAILADLTSALTEYTHRSKDAHHE